MKDINALIALLAIAALLLASGCATARHSTTYAVFPSDPESGMWQTPHTIP